MNRSFLRHIDSLAYAKLISEDKGRGVLEWNFVQFDVTKCTTVPFRVHSRHREARAPKRGRLFPPVPHRAWGDNQETFNLMIRSHVSVFCIFGTFYVQWDTISVGVAG